MKKHYVDINGVYLGRHGVKPLNAVAEVSESLVGKAFKIVEEEDEFGVTTKKVVLDEVSEDLIQSNLSKKSRVQEAYKRMSDDIYSKMLELFKTSKSDSAVAFHEQYKIMVDSPSLFSSQGLKSDRDIRDSEGSVVILKGQDLNSDSEILSYANYMLSEIALYSVYRIKRIEQFRAEKKAIEEE